MLSYTCFLVSPQFPVVCVDAVDEFTRPSHVSGLPIIALSLSLLMLPPVSISASPGLRVSCIIVLMRGAGAGRTCSLDLITRVIQRTSLDISCTNILVTRPPSYLHRSLESSRAFAN